MKKFHAITGVAAVMLIILDCVTSCDRLKPDISNQEEYSKYITYEGDIETLDNGKVLRVIDGDTFILDINNKQTTVRLIGIDTPESVSPDKDKNTVEGKEASDYLSDLILDKTVYLEYDVDKKDYYGRTLAYAYTEDGLLIEDILLKEGIARIMTVQPNSKYSEHFYLIEKEAKDNEVGFWNGFFETE